MSEPTPAPLTLHDAIQQAISLGEHDPHQVAATLRKRYDDKWLAQELLTMADDLVAELARAIIASSRRSSLSLAKIEATPKRQLMLEALWCGPVIGWVQLGKLTAQNFDYVAALYRKGAAALVRYAEWAEAQAAVMREQGVAEYRQVKGPLPTLPPAEVA